MVDIKENEIEFGFQQQIIILFQFFSYKYDMIQLNLPSQERLFSFNRKPVSQAHR